MGNKKTKIVVTGGAGFIGSNLVDALVKGDFRVDVIDNLSNGKKENVNPKATLHVLDVTNLNAIRPVFAGASYVFHLAALPRIQFSIRHPQKSHDVNVNGTINVLIASAQVGVKKLIYSSSSSIYGDQNKLPLTENMSARPQSPCGLQKYIGELYCRIWSQIYKLPTVSLRYFNVYGPRHSHEGAYALVIAKFFKQRAENKVITITGDGKQTRDFVHVNDVVQANILAMKSKRVGKGEVINIGAGKNQSILRIAELIGGPIKYIPACLEPRDTLADNGLARKLLGWKPEISIEKGIEGLKNDLTQLN